MEAKKCREKCLIPQPVLNPFYEMFQVSSLIFQQQQQRYTYSYIINNKLYHYIYKTWIIRMLNIN